jgi:2-oxoisovalerate dehydrogenase E1 component alpha subunit
LSRQGKAHFVITSAGHEATQFGCALAINAGRDYVVPYYRDMALVMALGQTPLDMMLHALGRQGDLASGGRQMFGHFSSRALRIVTATVRSAASRFTPSGWRWRSGQGRDGHCGDHAREARRRKCWHGPYFAGIHRLPVVFVRKPSTRFRFKSKKSVRDVAVKAGVQNAERDRRRQRLFAVYEAARVAMNRKRLAAATL